MRNLDFKSLMKLAKSGDADAQYHIGGRYVTVEGFAENDAEAVKWYRLAAEQGHAIAQYLLGNIYYNGHIARNYNEAVKWYTLAAEEGIVDAQSNLGFMYFNGYGVIKNDAEAEKWFRRAWKTGQ